MGKKLGLLAVLFLIPFTAIADNPVAFRVGPGAQMTCSASVPNHIATRGTFWCNSSDGNKAYYTDPSGASSIIGGGVGGIPQLLTATFTATDTTTLTWSNLGGTQFVYAGLPIITDGLGGVTFYVTGKTSTGATLHASAPFTGSVAVSVVSQ